MSPWSRSSPGSQTSSSPSTGPSSPQKSKPGWSQVRAVADNRVYLAPSLPWGWIDAPPSLNRLIGLRWLLSVFHPAEARIDLRSETREFYRLFYGVDPTDDQLAQLLGGAAN